MALVRWDASRELDTLQGEMSRLLSTFFDTPRRAARPPTATPPVGAGFVQAKPQRVKIGVTGGDGQVIDAGPATAPDAA